MKQEDKSKATRDHILMVAGTMFTSIGYEKTSMQKIVEKSGYSKGAIYHHFTSKEEMMDALLTQMVEQQHPFDEIRERKDLSGLEKMKLAILSHQYDAKQMDMTTQAISILKNPQILSGMIAKNLDFFAPVWKEFIEEGIADGSIHTTYAKELSQVLALLDFWFTPSLIPGTIEDIQHRFMMTKEVLEGLGLPLFDDELVTKVNHQLSKMKGDR